MLNASQAQASAALETFKTGAITDWIEWSTYIAHAYGHVRSLQKKLAVPKEIDEKAEFVDVLSEVTHFVEDISEVIPGSWDNSAAAVFKSLLLSDTGSEALFNTWLWWNEITPDDDDEDEDSGNAPTPADVGQQFGEECRKLAA